MAVFDTCTGCLWDLGTAHDGTGRKDWRGDGGLRKGSRGQDTSICSLLMLRPSSVAGSQSACHTPFR